MDAGICKNAVITPMIVIPTKVGIQFEPGKSLPPPAWTLALARVTGSGRLNT